MDSERLTFEEASREIGISEEELEQLVATGEIASIKEGDTIYFKKGVVDKFKKSREKGSPTILLADDEIDLLGEDMELDIGGGDAAEEETAPVRKASMGEELSLDDDLGLDDLDLLEIGDEGTDDLKTQETKRVGGSKPKSHAVTGASDDDTLLSLDGILEDDSEGTTPVPAVIGSDDTLLDTDDILDLEGLEGDSDPFASDTVEETSLTDVTEPGTLLRGGGARVMQMKRKRSHAAWTAVLAVASLLLILPVGITTHLLFAHSPQTPAGATPSPSTYSWIQEYNFLGGAVESIADIFRQ